MSLDPTTNRQEREAEKAKKQQDTPLNPPFPHKRQSFDAFFFQLEREPVVTPQTGGSSRSA